MMFKRILVPVDFSDCSLAALEHALKLREVTGGELRVVHAYEVPTFIPPHVVVMMGELDAPLSAHAERHATSQLDAFLKQVGDASQHISERWVLPGPPGLTILEAAKENDSDLIVMGTHGRTGLSRLVMGSVAAKLLRGSPCPVLTVRSEQ